MQFKSKIHCATIFLFFSLLTNLSLRAENLYTIASGDWYNDAIWSTGKVPLSTDNVEIKNNHTVSLFSSQTPVAVVSLCNNLVLNMNGTLITGHNLSSVNTLVNITGNLLCDGVITPGDSNLYNVGFQFNLTNEITTISGNGYLRVKNIKISSLSANKTVDFAHQFTVCDEDFFINSTYQTNLNIAENAYLNVKRNFGITGKEFNSLLATTGVVCSLKGVVVAKNVWLVTANTSMGSTLFLERNAALTAESFNNNNSTLKNKSGGFTLIVDANATLRRAKGCNDPQLLSSSDNYLTITLKNGARLTGLDQLVFPTAATLLSTLNPLKPINSSTIEADFANVYSATHIAGWYHFTSSPFLEEGVEAMKQFGSTNIKLAFSIVKTKMAQTYPFNHNWADYSNLVEMAKDPYWVKVFSDKHYKTITMWVSTRTMNGTGAYKDGAHIGNSKYWDEENQFYELAKFLLQNYPDKEFVFQNWEGDWMLRGEGVQWEDDPTLIPANIGTMLEGMRRMFMSRQRGVEKARKEVNGTGRVMLAVEANKLFSYKNGAYRTMMDLNTPCLTGDLFPHCRLDMVSWSSYDGIWSNVVNDFPIGISNGIDILASYMNPTYYCQKLPVILGEIGFNENPPYRPSGLNDTLLKDYYERLAALARYKNLSAYFLWNLYCSGNQSITLEKGVEYTASYLTPYLDGKWVIKPDGNLGFSGQKYVSFKNKLSPTSKIDHLFDSEKIKIYGNKISIGDEYKNRLFSIFSMNGVLQKLFINKSEFDISDLQQGLYILSSTNNKNQISIKFSKQN